MYTKLALVLAAITVVTARGTDFEEPEILHCSVTALNPPHASFFNLGRGPRVGDTIQLDMTKTEITDLTFDSGNSIPLKDVNAKMTKVISPDHSPYASYYEGTHQSPTSLYTGVLVAYHDEEGSQVQIEVVRKEPFVGLTLHEATLTCSHR